MIIPFMSKHVYVYIDTIFSWKLPLIMKSSVTNLYINNVYRDNLAD